MEIIKSVNEERVVGIKGTDKELAKLAEAIDNEFDWATVEQEYGLTGGFFYNLFTELNGEEE